MGPASPLVPLRSRPTPVTQDRCRLRASCAVDAGFMLLEPEAVQHAGAAPTPAGAQQAASATLAPPAPRSNCMVAAFMPFELHERGIRVVLAGPASGWEHTAA